jgi:hypothetical protein
MKKHISRKDAKAAKEEKIYEIVFFFASWRLCAKRFLEIAP